MGKEYAAFFTLLRAGLWERDLDDFSSFPLSSEGWEKVFVLARRQTVTGIVFRGMQYLPDAFFPQGTALMRWVAAVDAIERRNRQMDRVLGRLYAMFGDEGIRPVLQKGQGVARFYECPSMRECGDIDLYFPDPEMAAAALRCVEGRGIAVRRMPDGSHCYRVDGVCVEQHARLADLYDPFQYRRLKAMEKGWRDVLLPGTGTSVTVPSPLMDLLLLDTHILKHVLGWGIGLRQFCDMARACFMLRDEEDVRDMRRVSARLGLRRWNEVLFAFLTGYLGLPERYLPYVPERAVQADSLLGIVMRGGNFGHYVEGRGSVSGPVWRRKWNTSRSFLRNMGFACRYAPRETFWLCAGLLRGNLSEG